MREPFKLMGITLNDELTSFEEKRWCIVSCAEKSLCPSDFIITFLISFVGQVLVLQLRMMALNAVLLIGEHGSPFDAYLAR